MVLFAERVADFTSVLKARLFIVNTFQAEGFGLIKAYIRSTNRYVRYQANIRKV